VEEAIYLLVNGRGYGGMAMSHIEATNTAGEVDEDIAVNVTTANAKRRTASKKRSTVMSS